MIQQILLVLEIAFLIYFIKLKFCFGVTLKGEVEFFCHSQLRMQDILALTSVLAVVGYFLAYRHRSDK